MAITQPRVGAGDNVPRAYPGSIAKGINPERVESVHYRRAGFNPYRVVPL
jgi:hypothetical protein